MTLPSNPRRQRDLEWLARLGKDGIDAFPEPPPPPELKKAINEFNGGEYFRCHETLEALWLAEGYPARLFYQGILKIAVGLLHRERENQRGAKAKLREGLETLEPFQPRYMGVDVTALRRDTVAFTRPQIAANKDPS